MSGWEWLRVRHWSAYDAVRIALGLLLLTAAALKTHQLLTSPIAGDGPLESRWLLIGVVEFELFFGLWLLRGLYPRQTRLAAIVCFAVFACVSLVKSLTGAATCGCFGEVAINPWWTLALDAGVVILVLACRVQTTDEKDVSLSFGTRFGTVSLGAVWLCLALPAGVAIARAQSAVPDRIEDIRDTGQIVVLKPETWVGKRFPIVDFIDIGDRLKHGSWTVLVIHDGCARCQVAISNLSRRARSDSDSGRYSLVQVPPFHGDAARSLEPDVFAAVGRIRGSNQWFAKRPFFVQLSEGTVSRVSVGDHPDW